MMQNARAAARLAAHAAARPADARGRAAADPASPRCGKCPGFFNALRAEMMKSRHAAPVRLAVILALPFALLAFLNVFANPALGVSYSPWNYWYAALAPVMLSLACACVAHADARLKNRALLSSGIPCARLFWAKAAWCLMLSLLSNLIVFAIYALTAWCCQMWGGPGGAPVASMLAAAVSTTILTSWMIPATLFLTMCFGMLAGIFAPLAVQLCLGFAWSLVPFWEVVPPIASMIVPTAFLPVLPSGEPMSAAGDALAASLSTFGAQHAAALAFGIAVFAAAGALAAAWFARSEER